MELFHKNRRVFFQARQVSNTFKVKGKEFLPAECIQINGWVPDGAGTSVIGDIIIGY